MTMKVAKGSCLCGCVTVEAGAIESRMGACHCSMCRKWNAGPFMVADCGTDVTVSGEEHVTRYHSSDWGERAFCKNCGTHLFYRLKEANSYFVSSELFEGVDWQFAEEVFIDEKPHYYAFANDTKKMTGAEVFAAFGTEN